MTKGLPLEAPFRKTSAAFTRTQKRAVPCRHRPFSVLLLGCCALPRLPLLRKNIDFTGSSHAFVWQRPFRARGRLSFARRAAMSAAGLAAIAAAIVVVAATVVVIVAAAVVSAAAAIVPAAAAVSAAVPAAAAQDQNQDDDPPGAVAKTIVIPHKTNTSYEM